MCWRREARLGRLDFIFCKQIKICTIRRSCSEPPALAGRLYSICLVKFRIPKHGWRTLKYSCIC
ncbi:MAG: hypothetical protein ACK55Z_02685, partial [bacterium]